MVRVHPYILPQQHHILMLPYGLLSMIYLGVGSVYALMGSGLQGDLSPALQVPGMLYGLAQLVVNEIVGEVHERSAFLST